MEQTDKQKEEAQDSKLTGRKAKAKQVIIHACVTITEANAVHTHSHHALMTFCNVLPTSTYGLMPYNHNALPADNRVWFIKERSTCLPSCYSTHWVKCVMDFAHTIMYLAKHVLLVRAHKSKCPSNLLFAPNSDLALHQALLFSFASPGCHPSDQGSAFQLYAVT